MLSYRPSPLADITNVRVMQHNKVHEMTPASFRSCETVEQLSPTFGSPNSNVSNVRTHEPYRWKCLPDDDTPAVAKYPQPSSPLFAAAQPAETPREEPSAPSGTSVVCRTLIQFKCHQSEFSSPITVERGQFVVVQGDRGIDIGVVIRINTDAQKSYVERTGPTGSILRHATQREVDYWATELKADEAAAVEFCQQRVVRNHLPMDVRHAEYQFDKKKLTFYYDAKSRVDFVMLLRELYREYGCRIWMEKVRSHE